jgi:hypothetical protein
MSIWRASSAQRVRLTSAQQVVSSVTRPAPCNNACTRTARVVPCPTPDDIRLMLVMLPGELEMQPHDATMPGKLSPVSSFKNK